MESNTQWRDMEWKMGLEKKNRPSWDHLSTKLWRKKEGTKWVEGSWVGKTNVPLKIVRTVIDRPYRWLKIGPSVKTRLPRPTVGTWTFLRRKFNDENLTLPLPQTLTIVSLSYGPQKFSDVSLCNIKC